MNIDVPLVHRLVAGQFPQWAHLPVRPVEVGGWDNRTFHLGEGMTVRLPSAEGYVPQVDKEHRWLPRLAPLLPLPIPAPLARGVPAHGYPWPWSVYRWLEGETAAAGRIDDPTQLALALAHFLTALQATDPIGGPPAGPHNFHRGGPLTVYDAGTRAAVRTLADELDAGAVLGVWEAALTASWPGPPVWVHGDVAAGNLLVKEGRLSAVIDFGCLGIGDPACDLVMTWTFFSGESREAFRAALPLDTATWARARGWALWKALITVAEHRNTQPAKAEEARRVLGEVLADHARPA